MFGRLQLELVDAKIDDMHVMKLVDQKHEFTNTGDYRKLIKIANEQLGLFVNKIKLNSELDPFADVV